MFQRKSKFKNQNSYINYINSLWQRDAIWWHWTWSTLAQVEPDGTKPLSKPMFTDNQWCLVVFIYHELESYKFTIKAENTMALSSAFYRECEASGDTWQCLFQHHKVSCVCYEAIWIDTNSEMSVKSVATKTSIILPARRGHQVQREVNPLRANFFRGNINIYLHLCHYSTLI